MKTMASQPPQTSGALRSAFPRFASILRYAAVSVISTTVGLSTLAVLVEIGRWSAGWANVVATAVGTVPSFELNRRWVWNRDQPRSLHREIIPFAALCLVELVVSTFAVHTASRWAAHAGLSATMHTGVDLAANVAAYGTLWVAQYVILDKLLFAGGRPPGNFSRTGQPTLTSLQDGRRRTDLYLLPIERTQDGYSENQQSDN